MNGFLRGNLSTLKNKKLPLKGTWGTDLNVSFNLLLDIVIKSLTLKRNLMTGTFEDDKITVYKGLSLEKFIKYTGIPEKSIVEIQDNQFYWKSDSNRNEAAAVFIKECGEGSLYYKTPEMTSTSLEYLVALRHSQAHHNSEPVIMEITINKGTAFGKDFSKTSFGSDDLNSEVLLMPNQKIQILNAYFLTSTLRVEGQTVK